ncbi:MAG: hypothetical protein R2873_07970 [Caldilineaceae bacterium]
MLLAALGWGDTKGSEPLPLQLDFAGDFLLRRAEGIHTAIETAANFPGSAR